MALKFSRVIIHIGFWWSYLNEGGPSVSGTWTDPLFSIHHNTRSCDMRGYLSLRNSSLLNTITISVYQCILEWSITLKTLGLLQVSLHLLCTLTSLISVLIILLLVEWCPLLEVKNFHFAGGLHRLSTTLLLNARIILSHKSLLCLIPLTTIVLIILKVRLRML